MRIGFLNSDDMSYNSVRYFMDCIKKALNKEGIETLNIFEDEITGPLDAIIGINNTFPAERNEEGLFYLDLFQCPVFLILLDPPYYHHGTLRSHMNNLFLIVLDQGHADYCKRYYAPLKGADMAYMLGPVNTLKDYREKKIDCLFTGTFSCEYLDVRRIENDLFNRCGSEDISSTLFEQLLEIRIRCPEMPTVQAVIFLLEQNNIEYSDDQFKWMMNTLGTYSDLYMKVYYRKKLIQILVESGLTVHVAGNGWEKLYPSCPPGLILMGKIDFERTAELIADAKIALNVMDWKDGIHDRILTTMWNGSVCVTDSSSYIDAHFQDGKDIILYDFKKMEELPGRIKELLNDPDRAGSIANAGYLKVHNNYTWELFVKKYILNKIAS